MVVNAAGYVSLADVYDPWYTPSMPDDVYPARFDVLGINCFERAPNSLPIAHALCPIYLQRGHVNRLWLNVVEPVASPPISIPGRDP